MKGKLKKKACKPFDYFLMIIMLLVCFITLYPMWYIVANSLAAADSASLGATAWWPSSVRWYFKMSILSADFW